jgi:hypothetical protein
VLLVLGPGFNPCATGRMGEPRGGAGRVDEWEWEGFRLKVTAIGPHDDPKDRAHDFDRAIDSIVTQVDQLIERGTPAAKIALLGGSRGGGFFAKKNGLWDRMREGRMPKVSCFVLNVCAQVDGSRLPDDTSIVMTYGSHEGRHMLVYDNSSPPKPIGGGGKHPSGFSGFIRERGALNEVPPPGSLEGLLAAQPANRVRRFIYYKGDQSSVPSSAMQKLWGELAQTPEAIAKWPRPPHRYDWPPVGMDSPYDRDDKDSERRQCNWVKKPPEPPPFLGAGFVPKMRLSALGDWPTAAERNVPGPYGDGHDPASVYEDHCLLRLLDAALSTHPEVHAAIAARHASSS